MFLKGFRCAMVATPEGCLLLLPGFPPGWADIGIAELVESVEEVVQRQFGRVTGGNPGLVCCVVEASPGEMRQCPRKHLDQYLNAATVLRS